MLDSLLQTQYDKLKERVKTYDKYAKPSAMISRSTLWALLVAVALLVIAVFLSSGLAAYIFLAFMAYALFGVIVTTILDKKARVFRLSAFDLVTFYTCDIIENLSDYSSRHASDNPELKKIYRKNAIRDATNLISVLENNWTIGQFRLGKEIFGDKVSSFRDLFRTRLIPNIEQGNDSDLEKVGTIMLGLAYLKTLPELDHLNESMTKLTIYTPSEGGLIAKYSNRFQLKVVGYLNAHKVFRHILVVAGILFLCYLVYYLGINYVSISKDSAFIAAVSLFGVLLVGYVTYTHKGRVEEK
jgi:hypothetical protein